MKRKDDPAPDPFRKGGLQRTPVRTDVAHCPPDQPSVPNTGDQDSDLDCPTGAEQDGFSTDAMHESDTDSRAPSRERQRPEKRKARSPPNASQTQKSQKTLDFPALPALDTELPGRPVRGKDIEDLLSAAQTLEQMVARYSNTQRDIKKGVATLMSSVRDIARRTTEFGFASPGRASQICRSCSTSIPPGDAAVVTEIREALEGPLSDDIVAKLIARDWPEAAFKATKISGSSILTDKQHARAVLILNDDERDSRLLEQMATQFPALRSARDHLNDGKTVTLSNTDCLSVEGEESASSVRSLVASSVPLLPEGTPVEALNAHLWRATLAICGRMASRGPGPFSIAIPASSDLRSMRKILEISLSTHPNLTVEICGKNHRQRSGKSRTSRSAAPKLTSITINPGAQSYAEALRRVETSVDPSEQGVKVTKVTKTPTGEIRLLVRGPDQNSVSTFGDSIAAKTNLATSVRAPRDDVAVIVRDIPEHIPQKDLLEAVKTSAGHDGPISLSSYRPTRIGDFSCIVRLPRGPALRLIDKGAVTLGWTRCRLSRLVEVPQCQKCLSFEHRTPSCTKPESPPLCVRCGDPGHLAKNCSSEAKCYTCKTGGHYANSTSCPVFRDKINALRLGRKTN